MHSEIGEQYKMAKLSEFSIPIIGLKQEYYEFDYQLDKSFFDAFEDSPFKDGDISVYVDLEKKTTMMELFFDIEGTIKTSCDRCLATIDLPFSSQERLVIKYSEEAQEDTDEVVFIHPDTANFNIAQYIFEYIYLAVPTTKMYDCENDEVPPCDIDVINRIAAADESQDTATEEAENSLFSLLKNININ